MYLANHVANRLLNDAYFWLELLCNEKIYKDTRWAETERKKWAMGNRNIDLHSASDTDACNLQYLADGGKVYAVTNTVMDKLDLLRCKWTNEYQLDWRVFKNSNLFTSTFILPNNEAMRIREYNNVIMILLMGFTGVRTKENYAHLNCHYVFVNKDADYSVCEHLKQDTYLRSRSEYIYKLMAFIYLSDIEEELLKPGQSKGTKKTGKILNTLGRDITIINSKWNVRKVSVGPVEVSGHFAIRWTGKGRTLARIVLIDPYVKKGYTRKAGKESLE